MAHDHDDDDCGCPEPLGDEVPEWAQALVADGWAPMNHPPLNEEVEAHIERCYGKLWRVLHEHYSKCVHLDVNIIPPSEGRDFTVYVTSGMSDLPMSAPEGCEVLARMELLVALPGPPEAHSDPDGGEHYLVRALRNFARYPHETGAWLTYNHTIGGGDDPIGEDTAMTGFLIAPPLKAPIVKDQRKACRLRLSNGEHVNFAALIPLHPAEIAYKLEHDADALLDLLDRAGVSEVYDPNRPSVVGPGGQPLKHRIPRGSGGPGFFRRLFGL